MRKVVGFGFLIVMCCVLRIHAQSGVLDSPISLRFTDEHLLSVLGRISQAAPITFSYDSRHLPPTLISGDYEAIPLRKVLDEVMDPLSLAWELKGTIVVLRPASKPEGPSHFIISGYVEDGLTGERLVGAQVYDIHSRQGTITNEAGFFSLRLEPDSVKMIVSMLGYAMHVERFRLTKDLRRSVRLVSDLSLETVVINDAENLDPMTEGGASVIEVPLSEMGRLPSLMGEPDVLNILKLFPGVHAAEGSQGFYVRGGGPDQNLILMDGATVYNASHLFGFYSIFNSDAIKDVRLVKGGFPARYGGRLSSVVDIQVKDGNLQDYDGDVNIGLTSAKVMLHGPIVKGKTSFLVSARRTVLEPYFSVINHFTVPRQGNVLGYSFLDLQAKFQQVLGPKDRLLLGGYLGGDRFGSGYDIDTVGVSNQFDFGLRWKNSMGSLQWRHEWSQQLFSNFSVLYSLYSYTAESKAVLHLTGSPKVTNSLTTVSSVKDVGARWAFDLMPNCHHWLRFGAATTRHAFDPERFSQQVSGQPGDSSSTILRQRTILSLESSAWLEDQIKIGKRIQTNLGLHFSNYFVDSTYYWSVQPRVSARISLPANFGMGAAFTDMVQYIHLLSNSGVGLPTDLWVPATGNVPPQRSQQLSLALDKKIADGKWFLSAEGYYKRMTDLIDYQTGVNFIANTDWQDLVEKGGKGSSYGLEFLIRKNTGRLTGWLGYTLSKTDRQFDGINFGQPYPFKYDRRHDLSTTLVYTLTEKMDLSATWVYATGVAMTFPEAVYYAPSSTQLGFWDLNQGQDLDVIIDYGNRNSYRLPDYHRLDLNLRVHKKIKWGEIFWNVGIFNAYNRRNPYFLFLRADYSQDPTSPQIKVRKMSLLPILPEVNFGFKF